MLRNTPYIYLLKPGNDQFIVHISIWLEDGTSFSHLNDDGINGSRTRVLDLYAVSAPGQVNTGPVHTTYQFQADRANEDFILVNPIASGFNWSGNGGSAGGTSLDP